MTLDEMEQLCDAATPGPWVVQDRPTCSHIRRKINGDLVIDGSESGLEDCDAAFIAAARALMPKLIKVAKAAAAQHEAWTTKDVLRAIAELEQP